MNLMCSTRETLLQGTVIVRPVLTRQISLAVLFLFCGADWSCLFAAEDPGEPRSSVIHFHNGDYATGKLITSADVESLGWQSNVFSTPFQFATGGVTSVHFSAPAKLPTAEGAYVVELAGGDLLFCSLIGLDADVAILDVAGMGRLTVDRAVIQRMYRLQGGSEQLFVGPSGLNGWTTTGEQGQWREDAGHLTASKPGAVLRRNFGIPNQVRIEFELSWTSHPDFELAIGVGDDPKTISKSYRFEVWQNEIVVQRETEREADVVSLQRVNAKSGRLHVQAYLDQTLGRILVYSSNGEPLADMTVATAKPSVLGGIQLTNRGGEIRLERLLIGRWNGEAPRNVEVDKSRIHSSDGTITYGALKSFDADRREFVIGDDADSKRIAEDAVLDVFVSRPKDIAVRPVRAIFLTGMKVSGDIIRVDDQNIVLKSPGIHEPVNVPFASIQSLLVLKKKTEPEVLPQRRGRLEINGTVLHGCLVDSNEGDSSCLRWQPDFSTTSSSIQRGLSTRIVYREPPPEVQQVVQAEMPQVMVQRTGPQRVVRQQQARPNAKNVLSVLHLRTGDKIPCEVLEIDEMAGLKFKSAVSDATFVPHQQIKVLELQPDAAQGNIAKVKKERLLTLPRMQRDSPPTHLIRSIDGDYLRGRLVAMDENQLQVELRLEGKIVRRDRVVRIIWLHPEDLEPNNKTPDGDPAISNLIQALPSDGNRLTFTPEKVQGSTLSGKSEILGTCHVDLQQVDLLLTGAAIEQATEKLTFHQWKLKPAAEPLAPKEGAESGDGSEGQESPLVGKPAPEIALAILGEQGMKFRLSDHKQKVVILDFWASWCGPCLQVMPQIDKVAREFADQGVELYSINLEESPEKIKAALKRLNLSMPVLLDRDGRIAEKYGATSIPQTVIINRDGTVARLFVGASARFDDQLRAAVKAVLSPEPPKADPAK